MSDLKDSEKAWYERSSLKSLFIKAASNAMRGFHCVIASPHLVFSGTNSLIDYANYIGAYLGPNEKRILIVVDKDLVKFAEHVKNTLSGLKQIDCQIFSNVLPDVPEETIWEGVEACKAYDPKVIIAIGGGSAMDTAKLIMLFYEKPDINLYDVMAPSYMGLRKKVHSLVAMPTTSGTGAETTFIAVLKKKRPNGEYKKVEAVLYELCPDIAILYPEFVKTLPPRLVMGTGIDALAHAVGCYVLTMSTDFSDMANLKAIEMILKYLPRSVKYPKDMEAREKMQMAAFIAGVGFGNVSGGLEHGLGHSFGALFHVHHGICVGLFLCQSVAYQSKVTNRFHDLARVFGVETEGRGNDQILWDVLVKLREFMKRVGCPLSIRELEHPKISKDEYKAKIDQMVDFAYNDYCTLASTRKVDPPQFRKIYEMSYDNSLEDLMELYYM